MTEKEISEKYKNQLSDKDAEIIHVRTQLKEETNKNIAFLKEVDLKNREIAELKQSYDVTYADCENRLVDMRKEISGLEKDSEDLRMSKYWKINAKLAAEISKLEKQLANAENETLDKAIKLCDDEIAYEEYVKDRQTEPFKAMVQFGIARLEELKSALVAMKKETKTE